MTALLEEFEVIVEVALDVEDVSRDEDSKAAVETLDVEEISSDVERKVVVETLVVEEAALPWVPHSK